MTWYERLWFVSGFTAIVVILALQVVYHRRLRTRHRETWLDLGSPRLFQGSSARSSEQHRFLGSFVGAAFVVLSGRPP